MPEPILSSEERNAILRGKVDLVSASGSELTDEMLALSQEFARIHGRVRVCREKRGIHFYMASPECLEEDGIVELEKCHLAVNITEYLAGDIRASQCMKTGKPYNINDLLSMQPLSERGYRAKVEVIQVAAVNIDYLEPDGKGNMVPKNPGVVTPVYQLPKDHPARQYLAHRHYDPLRLYQQFRLSYGEKENPDLYYRKLLNGFKATPQGRIIFHIDIHGVNRGWQARILEAEHDGVRYYFHPYSRQWVKVLCFDPAHPKKWRALDERWEGWDPVKYLTGHGARRNECLLGFDAAVAHKRHTGDDFCFCLEGPLDAGRLGPPALASLGKSISLEQLQLILAHFKYLIYIPDNDAAGLKAMERTLALCVEHNYMDRVRVAQLTGDKDLGAMPEKEAHDFAYSYV